MVKERQLPVKRAAKLFNVPVQTLRDRVKGKVDHLSVHVGSESLFSHAEEEGIVDHLETLAQLGYGYTNVQVQHLAGDLALHLGKRTTGKPFSNNWLYGFLKRWSDRLASIKPRGLDSGRARNTTSAIVGSYFDTLGDVMSKYDFHNNPQRIYNVDETGIQPEHRPPNVIAAKGSKPPAITSPRSTTVTVMGCASASGHSIPPFFIFKGKRHNDDLMKGATPGARYTMSDSGWSNTAVFQEYIQKQFLPNVCGKPTSQQPVLLLLDGHSSHTSRSIIEWAKSHHIILQVLPAHTSHVLQPLDVSVFGPFKAYYYQECAYYMKRNMGQTIDRYSMGRIACKAYLKAMTPTNIISGFRKTGCYPLCPDVIARERLYPSEAFREAAPVHKVMAMKTGRGAVDDFLAEMAEKKTPPCKCNCSCNKPSVKSTNPKPKPSGRAITEDGYIEELTTYEQARQTTSASRPTTESQQPSTSGLNTSRNDVRDIVSSSEDDGEPDETDKCCVCNMTSPPDLHKLQYIKIVNWAECDACGHWTHLSFCTKVKAIRRNDSFLCPHCDS